MKNTTKRIVSFFNKLYLLMTTRGIATKNSTTFYLVKILPGNSNCLKFTSCILEKARININGKNNKIDANFSFISKSSISIEGDDNRISISTNVRLRSTNIVFRGNGCSLNIGENSSFGGIRIVNVGTDCSIDIGSDCMFADQIELWASDSHPIYDKSGTLINRERPVKVGNHVWVGSRVIILKGVTIADGAIIGMGSTVTKDVPGKSVSAGVPNQILRHEVEWEVYPR